MFCVQCKHDIPSCTCSDIEERLDKMLSIPSIAIAAAQNIAARKLKQAMDPVVKRVEEALVNTNLTHDQYDDILTMLDKRLRSRNH